MTFPFEVLSTSMREFGLVVAVLIGFAFGFVLERAGFGRATKLAGQFYLTDMTVFKVMFGAIITAMIGLVILSGIGLADFQNVAESAASTTFFWPMLVGGLMLGAGFIISGYCPGTSLVAASSGHIDGIATIVGVGIGSLLFGEVYPMIESFYLSGDSGQIFLFQLLDVPPAVVAGGVVLMAIGGFVGADSVERIFSQRRHLVSPESPIGTRRQVFTGLTWATAAGLILMAVPVASKSSQPVPVHEISAIDLARRMFDEPWKVMAIDLRSPEAFTSARIPNSMNVPAEQLGDIGLAYSSGKQDLVLIREGTLTALPRGAEAYPGKILVLSGGFEAWRTFALADPPPAPAGSDPQALADYQFQVSVYSKLTGIVAAVPVPVRSGTFTAPKKKRGGGCDG